MSKIEEEKQINEKIFYYLYRAKSIRSRMFGEFSEPDNMNDHIIEIAKMIQKEEQNHVKK